MKILYEYLYVWMSFVISVSVMLSLVRWVISMMWLIQSSTGNVHHVGNFSDVGNFSNVDNFGKIGKVSNGNIGKVILAISVMPVILVSLA